MHRFTVARLKRDQQIALGSQCSHELRADSTEVLWGRVDDGVPADRAGQCPVRYREIGEAALLELDARMCASGDRQHRRRDVHAEDLEPVTGQERCYTARTAADVGDWLRGAVCDELDERSKERSIERTVDGRGEFDADPLRVRVGGGVVGGAGRRHMIGPCHAQEGTADGPTHLLPAADRRAGRPETPGPR